jgi:hypothetical protein
VTLCESPLSSKSALNQQDSRLGGVIQNNTCSWFFGHPILFRFIRYDLPEETLCSFTEAHPQVTLEDSCEDTESRAEFQGG